MTASDAAALDEKQRCCESHLYAGRGPASALSAFLRAALPDDLLTSLSQKTGTTLEERPARPSFSRVDPRGRVGPRTRSSRLLRPLLR